MATEIQNIIASNIHTIQKRIRSACMAAGRDASSVRLITVTKTHPAEIIQYAVNAGMTELGENRVQELTQKAPEIKGNVSWHLVGHLQTNKVNKVTGLVKLIHSVDTFHLAEAIDKVSKQKHITTNILIQVNTSDEESKFGCKPSEVLPLVQQIAGLDNIKIRGLMTIGKFTDNTEEIRQCFRLLKKTAQEISDRKIKNVSMQELSMGMSNDFEIAIQEGATLVRVGTAIFGKRAQPNT